MTRSARGLSWSGAALLILMACSVGSQIPEALKAPAVEAVADLAEGEGIDTDAIVVQAAEFVTWPDASLGCPRPGQFYAQVITEGYRIVLKTEARDYAYHGATGRAPVLCQN